MNENLYYERSWLDGCFDFMHFGHANAILQAKITSNNVNFSKYKCIWIGLHSDEEIMQHKGSFPVMTLLERCFHVSFIRWVFKKGVVQNVPYVTELDVGVNDAYCEFVLHGDDLVCDANGKDCYYNVRKENRFLIVKRTEGVSTTEIIQRILTDSYKERDNIHDYNFFLQDKDDLKLCERLSFFKDGSSRYCWVYNKKFDNILVKGGWNWTDQDNIVFYNTSRMFDMLNAGDLEVLEYIKEKKFKNCKLIIGLKIGDETCVNNFRERLFSLVSCSLVDGVLINPSTEEIQNKDIKIDHIITDDSQLDIINSRFNYLTSEVIKDRIKSQRVIYEARNKKKLDS
ncbi:Nucleotidylyl transferase [Hanseniaspora valbyensis NRRL Y-1626]|uniref:ethanolamine-phosphate cytidylyltransferase n=1 Tax=Hanseniaspora valbyensis NRRL Y-1626 TaxID=766949 RepID=A0A1B7TD65_9ASCO|nr:Nucleotidylyl transferase [Hanseniaspora valbyensis NRRL Y-1626]